MKRKILGIISLLLVVAFLLVGCNGQSDDPNPPKEPDDTVNDSSDSTGDPDTPDAPKAATLNGVPLADYTIVYSPADVDYSKRAAEYIRDQIKARTSLELPLNKDSEEPAAHEIVVGETGREISGALDAQTEGTDFAIYADGESIALEGKYFVIAAAAYYFIETYVTGEVFDSAVPETVSIHQPIVEEAKNFIFLIGDGMGIYQTRLFDVRDMPERNDFSDGEDIFYGYLFGNFGLARTNSLSGTTDSAAAGTALATGYKTLNGYVGMDKNKNEIMSLTELAASIDMSTAVMSTEVSWGATPGAFSAHEDSRENTNEIKEDQAALKERFGTLIVHDMDYYHKLQIPQLERSINSTLDKLGSNENGFFLMYEESYIDKHCHSNDMDNAFLALVRFNQAIGVFMEYAFYNPDTFVIITADHETGAMLPSSSKGLKFTSGNHSPNYVPVFAYGEGAKLFDSKVIENVQIPKTIARMWNEEGFGDLSDGFEPLF